MSLIQTILSHGILALNILWIVVGFLYALYRLDLVSQAVRERLVDSKKLVSSYYREISFVLVGTATAGSLYFSQFLGWEPCLLCWYQRILMYPLAVIFGVGAFLKKDDVADYAMPLLIMGIGTSFYHYLVQVLDSFESAGCSAAQVSCDVKYMMDFDYITVPLMAFTVFTTVTVINWKLKG